MTHLLKLVEAIHILCSTKISEDDLDRADNLLKSFVEEYESLYGKENMVFNIHLLLHLVKCVRLNGPLFAYSNYHTEDLLGHLVDFVHGPTDVLSQITDRYLLETNLNRYLRMSPRASHYNEEIKSKHFYITFKLDNFLLVGNGVKSDEESVNFVHQELNLTMNEKVISYRAGFFDSEVYFESVTPRSLQKRTYDSFVCNPDAQIYGEIENILVVENQVFYVVNNKYTVKENARNIKDILIHLEMKQERDIRLIKPELVKEKYAFIKTNTMVICSKFPNLYERN